MIRRNPTLIGMCDTDVQQVRDAVAKRKMQARETAQPFVAAPTHMKSAPATVPPLDQPFVAAEDAKRKREAMTRDERLGLR